MGFDPKSAALRLRAIGIKPGLAHQLVSDIQRWIRGSGEEWTVERVKSIKQDLLRHSCGLRPLRSASWTRYRKSGIPKGPWGALFKLSHSNMVVAWNAVMVYTGLVFQDPDIRVTAKQWNKAVSAIRREALSVSSLVEGMALVHRSPLCVPVRLPETTGDRLIDYPVRPSRRAPIDRQTTEEGKGILNLWPLMRRPFWATENWDILSGTVEGLEKTVVPFMELNIQDELRAGGDPPEEIPEMGLISLIQEAGYKLRFAANPYRVYQAALQPLGRALFDTLRRIPNDFTFDQQAGVDFVQHLTRGEQPIASMDLSNATDNFPLALQLEFLSRLGVSSRWIQFLKSTCSGEWFTSTARRGPWVSLSWTVGSPLGLYPTFPAFALTHHAVVQEAFRLAGRDVSQRLPYAVVGDDVVIGDQDVASIYRHMMESLGVPISDHKSIVALNTAEFVGRVITPNSVVQGFKWKGRMSDQSFVDFARMIGPGSLILMRPRQKRVLSYIADLPEPYGLGWNPFGIPLSERLTPDIEMVWSRDERVRHFERRAQRLHRLIYMRAPSRPFLSLEEISVSDALASDQDAREVVEQLLPGWESWEEAIWPNLSEVAPLRDVTPDTLHGLRLMLHRSSSVETRKEASTLVVLERKIRRAVARSL